MNNWIKKLNSIRLFIPEELRKKEFITLNEIFDQDENANLYQEVLDNFINEEVNKQLEQKLTNKTNEFKKELSLEYNQKLLESKEKYEEFYQMSSKERVDSISALLQREKEAVLELKERLTSNESLLINLQKEQEKIYEEKLNDIKKDFQKIITEKDIEIAGKQTATQIGEFGEESVMQALKTLFPEDNIIKPNSALGEADVLQTLNNGSTFYYEVKNRKSWSMANLINFSDKVRTRDDAAYFFISKALPKKSNTFIEVDKDVFYDPLHNIYITSFETYLPLVFAIRKLNLTFSNKLAQVESANEINKRILDFVSSSEFQNYFTQIKDKFLSLDKVFKNIQRETQSGIRLSNEIDITVGNFKIDIESKLN